MESHDETQIKVSRRRFLEATVVTAAAAKTVRADSVDADQERLERIIEQYGSELGELREVR